jgi:phosphatidate cytidylyltransferase
MLGTRVIVGFLLAVGGFFVIVHGTWIYFVVMALLALLALAEFYRITKPYRPAALAGILALFLMVYCGWWGTPTGVLGALALSVALAFVIVASGGPRRGVTARMAITILGPMWIGLGFACLLLMRRLPEGMSLVLIVVFGTWAGDTFAYFIGRYFGSTPMAPRLSPKKTWEGFAGGLLGTVIGVVLIALLAGAIRPDTPGVSSSQALLIGLVIAVVGPLGDLFESLIKRDVDVKDAGRFLPGHGGVLDRFDALIFSSVAVYFLSVGFLSL